MQRRQICELTVELGVTFPHACPFCLLVMCSCPWGLGHQAGAGCGREASGAGWDGDGWGLPFSCRLADSCASPHRSGACGQPILASWPLLVGGNTLPAVWPKGNQSGGTSLSQGRGLRCGQGGERQETEECVYFGSSQPQKSHREHFTTN